MQRGFIYQQRLDGLRLNTSGRTRRGVKVPAKDHTHKGTW